MNKVIISCFIAVGVFANNSCVFALSNPFVDIPANHWATKAVTSLASKGVIEGYGDATFKGDRNITRYEAASMISKIIIPTFNARHEKKFPFADVPKNHWANFFVESIFEAGISKGYDDNTFRGDRYITRYEMAQMLSKFLGLSNSAPNPFSDVPAGHWAKNAVTVLASKGIIEGYGDATFRGDRNITRYEAAMMISKTTAVK